jgi:hypothetical protein
MGGILGSGRFVLVSFVVKASAEEHVEALYQLPEKRRS